MVSAASLKNQLEAFRTLLTLLSPNPTVGPKLLWPRHPACSPVHLSGQNDGFHGSFFSDFSDEAPNSKVWNLRTSEKGHIQYYATINLNLNSKNHNDLMDMFGKYVFMYSYACNNQNHLDLWIVFNGRTDRLT